MKQPLSLTTVLSTAALTGGLLLTSLNPTAASGCPFSKSKNVGTSGNFSSLVTKNLGFNQIGVAGAGIATLAGLLAAGMAYKARRSHDAIVSETTPEQLEVAVEAVSDEVLYVPTFEETASPEKDLALVGK